MNLFTTEQIEMIQAPIPEKLIKTRKNGNIELSYLSGSTIIDMLNKIFNYMWDWKVDKVWTEKNLKFEEKYEHVAHVLGTLTVYVSDGEKLVPIQKMASGSKVVVGGISQQDSIYKAAGTDALKKAASLFGIGLSLWRDEEEEQIMTVDRMKRMFNEAWTKEKKEEFKNELDLLGRFVKSKDGNVVINDILNYSGGTKSSLLEILPEDIIGFTNYLTDKYKEVE